LGCVRGPVWLGGCGHHYLTHRTAAMRGTATVRLNSARDEVEHINVEGRAGRNDVLGTFKSN